MTGNKNFTLLGGVLLLIVVGGVILWQRGLLSPAAQPVQEIKEIKQTANEAAQQVTEAATAQWRAVLGEQNNSGELGVVTIDDADGGAKVIVTLSGAPVTAQPAHIHAGACPTPGAVKYPLADVVNGKSETIIPVKVADLKGMLPLAVNVHKSAAEIDSYVACGDLK